MSVQRLDYPNISVIVVDNGSTDESIITIRARFPAVTIIENGANLGFAAGNNRGIEYAREAGIEWLFLLNPDTTVASDCLQKMIQIAGRDSTIGMLGPMIYYADEPMTIQSAGGSLDPLWNPTHRGQNELDRGQYDKPLDVDWLSGCAMLVNGKIVEGIGTLDEQFFMYEEELDWCIRVRRAGWHIVNVPHAKVWHKGVQRDYCPQPQVTYYMTRNHLLLLDKHRAGFSPFLYAQFQIVRTLISWTTRPKWRIQQKHRDSMLWGIIDYYRRKFGHVAP